MRPTAVLTDVVHLDDNSYLSSWSDAMRRAGLELRPLSRHEVLDGRPPVWVHLQWPERWVARESRVAALRHAVVMLSLVVVARLRGARVLITAHNVAAHQPLHPVLDRLLTVAVDHLVTDVHVMTSAGADEWLAGHPRAAGARRHVIPHGNYSTTRPLTDRAAARAHLGLAESGFVFAHVGAIKPYKGAEELILAFRGTNDADSRLVLAGRVLDPRVQVLLRDVDTRVVVRDEFLPTDELDAVLAAADRVVLPYRRVLNSGTVLHALSRGRPVLVPATPTFCELQERVGHGWITTYEGQLSEDDLERSRRLPSGRPDLQWCDWSEIEGLLRKTFLGSDH